jgi:hypothetical protein
MERKFQALFFHPHHLVPNANAFIHFLFVFKGVPCFGVGRL